MSDVWMEEPDDCPAYQDAYEWEPVEVRITVDTEEVLRIAREITEKRSGLMERLAAIEAAERESGQ